MKITIKNLDIELKNKMRVYLIYEEISGKPFAPLSLMDIVVYMYSVILANKPDLELTFEELLDSMDGNPEILTTFKQWVEIEGNKNKVFPKEDSKKN